MIQARRGRGFDRFPFAIIGLTGSIGMGKSTAARLFRRLGVPVHDADEAARAALAPGSPALRPLAREFPAIVRHGRVDRAALAARVFADATALGKLEAIVHPMVRAAEGRFLRDLARRRVRLAVLDIPLLFESGAERRCDCVVVVSAPPFLQKARVLKRPGMTPALFAAVLTRQMPDAAKRRRADIVVPTGAGLAMTFDRLRRIVREAKRGRRRPRI